MNVTGWLKSAKPDVVLMQEIKCTDDGFPRLEIEDLGYNVATVGQKTYNGVAILSRHPLTVEEKALPGAPEDEQARYIEGLIEAPKGKDAKRVTLRVASIYLQNGNPSGTEQFTYKLSWMERLRAHAAALLKLEEVLVLGGDYNVAPTDDDVYDPEGWRDDALCRPESRRALRMIVNLGYTDAIRALHSQPHLYTFWDYQAGRWPRDEGLRIDHLALSPQAADRLAGAGVDKFTRAWEKPSDHCPAWVEIAA